MKEKHLHKIIRDSGTRNNTLLADALKAKHPELKATEAQPHNRRNRIYRRLTAVFTALSVAEALALILVPSLLLSGGNSSLPTGGGTRPPAGPPSGLGGDAQTSYYRCKNMNCSVQEYNQAHDTNFLFFSTVEYDYKLYEYRSFGDKFLGLKVAFICDYYDEHIGYKVCAKDAELDIVSYDISVCTNEGVVSDCPVKWCTTDYGSSYGIFSYEDYDYYIYVSGDTERLFELIQELLQSQP